MGKYSDLQFGSIDTASSGDNTLVLAAAGKKVRVFSYVFVASGAVAVRWKSGANNKSGAMALAANGGIAMPATRDFGEVLATNAGEALILNLGGAVQVSGHFTYTQEA